MKHVAKILLILFAFTFLGVGIKLFFFPAHVAEKTVETAEGVVDQTLNADNAIANYEQFKDGYNGAKAMAQNIANSEKSIVDLKDWYGEADTWTKDMREEYAFLNQTMEGYKMQYQSIVKDYNSNSSKLNRNLFKDSDLPAELPLDYKEIK
jgi:hypothetical protein